MRKFFHDAARSRTGRIAAPLVAAVLLLTGIFMAVFNESSYNQQKAREISVQAQITSASVAPALMFYNNASAQEYLNALGANPSIAAAAVYDERGVRVASFHRQGAPAAPLTASVQSPRVLGRSLIVVTPVARDGETLGAIYLRTDTESPLRRFSRYAGVGILVLLGALVLIVFGLAQGALSEANAQLEARARQLQQEIEQRERAEEALVQSRKLEAIGQLTGGVAHDFNNLLTVILSGLRLMERNNDPERRASTTEAMRQAVERGAGLTRQLLAFSRRQKLKLEAIDVSDCLLRMRELLTRSLRADILIDIVAPKELWPIKTDPTQFELAILNLAVNARDAMPKGGVLTITGVNVTDESGDGVEISVRDTGLGMPKEVLSRVFEPYFTTKQAGQGTGLGLSQVYGIVLQSGGDTRIESVVNEGTRVTLRFPRSEDMPAPRAAEAAPSALPPAAGRSVLVVEDDDSVAAIVEEMLEQMGFVSTRVPSAQSALGALETNSNYDVVFSDIVMPGAMNGVDLAHEIRRRHPQKPVVLTTGFSGAATIGEEFPVLRKPYQMEELQKILTEALAPVTGGLARVGAK